MIFNGLIKSIRAIIAAYWPLWIFGIIIISIDFLSLNRRLKLYYYDFIVYRRGRDFSRNRSYYRNKIFAKLPYHSIKITTLMFQTTLNHPPVEEKFG